MTRNTITPFLLIKQGSPVTRRSPEDKKSRSQEASSQVVIGWGSRRVCQDGRGMNGESKRRKFRSGHPKNGRGRRAMTKTRLRRVERCLKSAAICIVAPRPEELGLRSRRYSTRPRRENYSDTV